MFARDDQHPNTNEITACRRYSRSSIAASLSYDIRRSNSGGPISLLNVTGLVMIMRQRIRRRSNRGVRHLCSVVLIVTRV